VQQRSELQNGRRRAQILDFACHGLEAHPIYHRHQARYRDLRIGLP
jgi:hypothetical protein